MMTLVSCSGDENVYLPKAKGYNYIPLPTAEYQKFQKEGTPYTFEYSKFATLKDDTSHIAEAHWKELFYPAHKAEISITYKPILKSKERLDSLVRTANKLTYEHTVKSDEIKKEFLTLENGNQANLYYVYGQVPTTFQFFTHDSTDHFFRACLYFPTALKNDSLRSVIDYCITDMKHLMNTLEFVNEKK